MASRLHKRAEDHLDYYLDLRRFLEPGEYIVGATGSLRPETSPALVMPLLEFARTAVTIWLDGGRNGESYSVSVTVMTSGGRTMLFRFYVTIRGCAAVHAVEADDIAPVGVGDGFAPSLLLSVDHVTFPATAVGQVSAPIVVTVTNPGRNPVSIYSIAISDDFSFTSDANGEIESGDSIALSVRFAPSQAGTIGGYIVIDCAASTSLVLLAQAL